MEINYPKTTSALRVWAVEQVLDHTSQILTEDNIANRITMAEQLVAYVNQDEVIPTVEESSTSEVMRAVIPLISFMREIIASEKTLDPVATESCVGCASKTRKSRGKKATTETEVVDTTTETENVIELNEEA